MLADILGAMVLIAMAVVCEYWLGDKPVNHPYHEDEVERRWLEKYGDDRQ